MRHKLVAVVTVLILLVWCTPAFSAEYNEATPPQEIWALLVNGLKETGIKWQDKLGDVTYTRSMASTEDREKSSALAYNASNGTLTLTISHYKVDAKIIGKDDQAEVKKRTSLTQFTMIDFGTDAAPDIVIATDTVLLANGTLGTVINRVHPVRYDIPVQDLPGEGIEHMKYLATWLWWVDGYLKTFGHEYSGPPVKKRNM